MRLAASRSFAIATERHWAAIAFAAAVLAIVPSGCSVGDAVCTADEDTKLKDEACPYGPPGGPRLQGGGCAAVTIETDTTKCVYGWDEHVYPRFADLFCAGAACHGAPPGAYNIYLPSGDPANGYKALEEYLDPQGNPYISDDTPERAWILCNLEAQPGGGSPMPPKAGLTDADTLAMVRQWVRCGMKREPLAEGAASAASSGASGGGAGEGGADGGL